ncbi:hypothetical protein KGG73_gp17 [Streptomyces phage Sentinel]|uniref:Minor tail protein n=1 Tax=Streptomyces phage Sentinel TaxID=2767584 RepID=A0A873WQA2_9CAUD|nr:hypothetical protein KGG73_gp17 [Streptomyces phage Sentinel]QPB09851.1 hypothetical protein CPT_Sentinel_017 [Streptomyces phage Sentinel]
MGFSVIPEPAISGFTGPQGAAGAKGDPGVIQSINGKSAASVTLAASDVNALPSNGNALLSAQYLWLDTAAGTYRAFGYKTAGVDRWLIQVDDVAETGSAAGSNFRLSARNDDGSFNKTVIYARRDTGQIALGTTTIQGDAQVTSAAAIGMRNQTADPATNSGGAYIYAKGGLLYAKQGDGTVFQVTAGGGGGGAVQSVNGKTGAVVLAASDVGALPTSGGTAYSLSMDGGAGTYRALSWKTGGALRWATQVNDTAESGSDAGSNFELTAWGDNGGYKGTAIFAERATARVGINTGSTLEPGAALTVGGETKINGRVTATKGFTVTSTDVNQNPIIVDTPTGQAARLQVMRVNGVDQFSVGTDGSTTIAGGLTAGGTSTVPNLRVGSSGSFAGASGSIIAMANASTLPSSNPAGSILYTTGGVPRFRESNGADYAVTPVSEFTPESLGALAWAGDPDNCASGFDYCGVGTGRMTAVYVNRTMTVSKIIWHMMGYAGGLLTGSWAGIYNTSGTLQRATGDLSTAAYEPAEQHSTGGGWSSSNLTSAITLTPGVYYILWRFNYTASPVDGPALARYESAAACQSVMGNGVTVWRHASYSTSATSAPSTITVGSFGRDSIRFWVALA